MTSLHFQSIADRLQEPPGKIYIAYSGGIDSHVLLHLCASQAYWRHKLIAVYVDHGLQAASTGWREHCRQQAAALGVEFQAYEADAKPQAGESPEAAARHGRYRVLRNLLSEGDSVLLAQHREDQMETLLLQLFRGAGVHGLAAMPATTPFGSGSMQRPLLHTAKQDIVDYAKHHGLQWVEDPSNQSSDFDRNFLRNEIVPLLKQRWPSLDKTVARSAHLCGEAALLLDNWSDCLLQNVLDRQHNTLDIGKLQALGFPDRNRLLRHWFALLGLKPLSQAVLEEVIRQFIDSGSDANPQIFLQGHWLKKYRQRLFCINADQLQAEHEDRIWDRNLTELNLRSGYRIALRPADSGIDRQLWLSSKITVKPRRSGEKLKLPGRSGRHGLKKLYQEAGIPPWERDTRPLVYINDRLAAVAGLWIDEWAWNDKTACFQLLWKRQGDPN